MRFDLKRPCRDCPFRTDVRGYLTPARAEEITAAVLKGDATFTCHKTLTGEYVETDDESIYVPGDTGEQHCAGALILEAKAGHPNLPIRLARMTSMLDTDRLDMTAPVFDTAEEMIEHMRRSR